MTKIEMGTPGDFDRPATEDEALDRLERRAIISIRYIRLATHGRSIHYSWVMRRLRLVAELCPPHT